MLGMGIHLSNTQDSWAIFPVCFGSHLSFNSFIYSNIGNSSVSLSCSRNDLHLKITITFHITEIYGMKLHILKIKYTKFCWEQTTFVVYIYHLRQPSENMVILIVFKIGYIYLHLYGLVLGDAMALPCCMDAGYYRYYY